MRKGLKDDEKYNWTLITEYSKILACEKDLGKKLERSHTDDRILEKNKAIATNVDKLVNFFFWRKVINLPLSFQRF